MCVTAANEKNLILSDTLHKTLSAPAKWQYVKMTQLSYAISMYVFLIYGQGFNDEGVNTHSNSYPLSRLLYEPYLIKDQL